MTDLEQRSHVYVLHTLEPLPELLPRSKVIADHEAMHAAQAEGKIVNPHYRPHVHEPEASK